MYKIKRYKMVGQQHTYCYCLLQMVNPTKLVTHCFSNSPFPPKPIRDLLKACKEVANA
jgi:hypothetical protein